MTTAKETVREVGGGGGCNGSQSMSQTQQKELFINIKDYIELTLSVSFSYSLVSNINSAYFFWALGQAVKKSRITQR